MQKTSFIMILSIIIFFSSLLVNEINEKCDSKFPRITLYRNIHSYIHWPRSSDRCRPNRCISSTDRGGKKEIGHDTFSEFQFRSIYLLRFFSNNVSKILLSSNSLRFKLKKKKKITKLEKIIDKHDRAFSKWVEIFHRITFRTRITNLNATLCRC